MASPRYAIYFAPQHGTDLHRFGTEWLGRDSVSNEERAPAELASVRPDRWRAITAAARVYGFHATLKPPFCLKRGRTADELCDALEAFVQTRRLFCGPPLRAASIGGFLALTLSGPSSEWTELAADCVRDFDSFRMASTPQEVARRRNGSLTPRQAELVKIWGYPYVLDEWQFHMTLTEKLETEERENICAELQAKLEPILNKPMPVDAISLFEQSRPESPFRQIRRFRFGGR